MALGFCMPSGCDRSPSAQSPSLEAAPSAASVTDAAPKAPAEKPDRVVAFYFHGDRRCKTCLGMQDAIERTVRERFGAETAKGRLTFREINFEKDANKHFVREFQLSFSSLVVATMAGERTIRWENGDKLWEYAHDPPALMDYTEARIRAFLELLEGP